MTTSAAPQSPLDGLVSCGLCGALMDYKSPDQDQEARYACSENQGAGDQSAVDSGHQPLEVQVDTTDRRVISGVMETVLTERNISSLKSYIIKELDEQGETGSDFPFEDIGLLKDDAYFFLRAVDGVENARNFLATFITRIRLLPDRAVVQYSLPLPADSRLAGATEQEIPLPADISG